MDERLRRQTAIQRHLARRHLNGGPVVLDDITSVSFEGEYQESEWVTFGDNRDGKSGYEQVVVGLICTAQGCPIGVDVYARNTKDETTVIDKGHEIKADYGIEQVVFVGDRGVITQSHVEALKDEADLQTVSALTHGEMTTLLKTEVIALDRFDERSIHDVTDPDDPTRRYCLCRNPQTAQRERQTHERLLALTTTALANIAASQRATTVEKLGARVGKILANYKMGKFIRWSIDADPDKPKSRAHRLVWSTDTDKVAREQRFDGYYIITSDVAQEAMSTVAVVNAYKSLTFVARAFRNLKTVQLEIRPVYHKTDERIRRHVFLGRLAYYLQWHMEQRLAPLFAAHGQGPERRWTFRGVIDCLTQITRNQVTVNGVELYQNSTPTPEQEEILNLLQVAM